MVSSDLIGTVKDFDFELSTLYIDKRLGLVILTSRTLTSMGTVVHSVTRNFKVGELLIIKKDDYKFEKLTGKIVLSNYTS